MSSARALAVLVAVAAAPLPACGPRGMPEAPPPKGTPCADVGLPKSSGLPRDERCRVLDSAVTKSLAAITWGWSDTTTGGGTVLVDRSTTELRAVAINYWTDEAPWTLYRARDVTGDGLDDAILRSADYTDADAAPYRILTRRPDGFGDTGIYVLTSPVWIGDGTFKAGHSTGGTREPFVWRFTGHRWARLSTGGETAVTGLTATASSGLDKNVAAGAVDGDYATAWCEGKPGEGLGETLTVTLPSAIKVARISFATGWDALRKGEDLWHAHDQIIGATLLLDGGIRKRMIVDRGARWVDYIPHDEYSTSSVAITIENLEASKSEKTRGVSCINEVEVWAR